MDRKQREVVRLRFEGAPYDGRSLDAAALETLVQFQGIVTKTAEALWRARNPGCERVPKDLGKRTQFVIRTIEEGSTVVPLELSVNSNQPDHDSGEAEELKEAVDLIYRTFSAADIDKLLPENMPKEILSILAKFGQGLPKNANVLLAPPGREMTPVSPRARKRLRDITEQSYWDEAAVTGHVLEADVRQKRFQIWMDQETSAYVKFTEDQESDVIAALKDYASAKLFVKGRGSFASDGKLQRIQDVTSLKVVLDSDVGVDKSVPRIEDKIAEIFGDVPDEEWDKLPDDLSHRHDFYIYGKDE